MRDRRTQKMASAETVASPKSAQAQDKTPDKSQDKVQAPRTYDQKQQLEISLAAMENRLRTAITELVQPTIQRTTLVVADVEQIKNQVNQHTRGLQEVQLGQVRVTEQMATIGTFKEEMARWDTQRRSHESNIDEKVETINQRMETYRYSLDQKESALHHLHRSIDRMATELNHAMDSQDALKEEAESRMDDLSRKVHRFENEVEVRLAGMELKHNSLTDELWGEETGLAKVAGELKRTNMMYNKLETSVAGLQAEKAEASLLDRLHSDVVRMVHDANTAVSAMRQSVGNVVNDVREHFRTASETISAHNATFVTQVRQEYQAELSSAAKLREEVQEFMTQVGKDIDGIDARVAGAARKADSIAAETREELEELNRRRKCDKSASDQEFKALKKRLSGVFENSDAVLRGIEHIYSVLKIMLDSDAIQYKLELQDSIDKKKIMLMGMKDEDKTLGKSALSEQVKPQKPRGVLRGGPGVFTKKQEPVLHVDNRCLSCSGQSPFILSAFKMACLQYSPSPVEFEGCHYERGELLAKRQNLLDEAMTGLRAGPVDLQDGFISTGQVGKIQDQCGSALPDFSGDLIGRSPRGSLVKLPDLAQALGALTAR